MTASRSSLKPVQDPLVGQLLFGEYAVLDVLGDNDGARVYLAKQITRDRLVAMKTLKVLKPEIVAQFSADMEKHRALRHENIVETVACHHTEIGRPFFVMEYIEGTTLLELVLSGGELTTEDDLSQVVLPVCRALEYGHEAGHVHGNLTPGNIMLDELEGQLIVRLVDFGLSNVKPAIEQFTGTSLLSYGYAAPEILRRARFDAPADIYSLAAVVYMLITGKPPIDASDCKAYAQKGIQLPEPLSLTGSRTNLFALVEFERILNKGLKVEPGERYQSIKEFRCDFEQWSECARQQRLLCGATTTSTEESESTSDLVSKLKESVHNIETLKQTQRRTEETIIMRVSDTLAAKGPRQSPKQLIVKLMITGMLIAAFAILAYSASTQHSEAIRSGWSTASINLSKGITSKKTSREEHRKVELAPAPAPAEKSPLLTASEMDSDRQSSALLPNSNFGKLNPKDPWPVEKLLIEVPYNPSASPSYGVTNNSR